MRALKRKLALVEKMGGKCSKCGYSQNLAALHFHHVDPHQKEFKLGARMLSNKKWDDLVQEVEKCVLLCANCHAEVHHPEMEVSQVYRAINGDTRRKRRAEKGG